jgi:hypothetical protein
MRLDERIIWVPGFNNLISYRGQTNTVLTASETEQLLAIFIDKFRFCS